MYDFAHIHSHNKFTFGNLAPDTQLYTEDDVILHRFGGATIYRMDKVRRNTIDDKKRNHESNRRTQGKSKEGA